MLATPGSSSAAVEREVRTSAEPTGLVVVTPDRVEEKVQPGEQSVIQLEIYNDDEETIDVSLFMSDLGPAADPKSIAARVEDGEFGAGDWISPELTDLRLQPFEAARFDVVIEPPLTAPIGTNLGAITVRASVAAGAVGSRDDEGVLQVDAIVQFFLTAPGPVDHDLRIHEVDVRDSFVLGSQRFAVWEVTFENRGTVNEHVSGTASIRSIFGNTVHRTKITNLIVLRGARRTTRIHWADLPWVGVFTPQVRVRGDDARLVEAKGERIAVMPWWLPVVLAAAILAPAVVMWWRRRREWRRYLDEEDWDDGGELDDDGAPLPGR